MDLVVVTDVTCLDELLGMVQLSLPLGLTLLMLLPVLLLQLQQFSEVLGFVFEVISLHILTLSSLLQEESRKSK